MTTEKMPVIICEIQRKHPVFGDFIMDIEKIQKYLADHELDGWLMADFHARNTVAMQMLQLSGFLTRRSFFFIPVEGEPLAIVHAIEQDKFANLPGHHIKYSGYKTLEQELEARLSGCKKLAMEYSPMGRLPYIGLVDAGTIELVKSFGIEVVSSADLVASFQARLSAEQIATHRIAAANVIEIKDKAFAFITDSLKDGRSITEFDVMRQILKLFEEYDMETSSFPVCAVDANAGTLAKRTSLTSGYDGSLGTNIDLMRTSEASDWT